ncbi:hypothetical protein PTKIN_Ptkin11bG0205800 [Pterospermum kingtungense]
MGRETLLSCLAVFFLFFGVSAASTSISDLTFYFVTFTACPVNFEFLNYTTITSKCKGPNYPPDQCCSAFKEFACPYVDQINDLTTDCASTMFSYINLYGKYPPGLFASECREGKEGLACPASPPSTSANENASGSQLICNPSLLLTSTAGFLEFLFMLL